MKITSKDYVENKLEELKREQINLLEERVKLLDILIPPKKKKKPVKFTYKEVKKAYNKLIASMLKPKNKEITIKYSEICDKINRLTHIAWCYHEASLLLEVHSSETDIANYFKEKLNISKYALSRYDGIPVAKLPLPILHLKLEVEERKSFMEKEIYIYI